MQCITGKTFDEERALYGVRDMTVRDCTFDGPADGESAFKEGANIVAQDCFFNLRYPFWHDRGLTIEGCEMTEKARAALWYSSDILVTRSQLHGIKALRECDRVRIENCDIVSSEFGWSTRDCVMRDCTVESEYFMMRAERLHFDRVTLSGKYSFQYIIDSTFEACEFTTKDAFWHARNVTVRDSIVRGEYLGWYSENLTFENCTIIGTQPLCYCKGLRLVNCKMIDCDLAFEKSEVDAELAAPIVSIKNPRSGGIVVPQVGEIILDDPDAKAEIVVG